MQSRTITYANLVIIAGKDGGKQLMLLDLANDLVLPVLMSDRQRDAGKSHYFFIDQQVLRLDDGTHAVGFEFVKSTTLSRDQVWKNGRLVKSSQSIESAPSAIGLLELETHRLIYIAKTDYAPTVAELRATLKILLTQHARAMSEAQRARAWPNVPTETLDALKINLVELGSETEIEAALAKFKKITKLRIEVLPTNHEYHGGEWLDAFRTSQIELGAKKAVAEFTSRSGLDRNATGKEIAPVVKQGSAKVKAEGRSLDDEPAKADNNTMRTKERASFEPQGVSDAAQQMHDALQNVAAAGRVVLPTVGQLAVTAARSIYDKWRKR